MIDAKNVAGFAELGVVFLLFLIGLELSYERLMTMRRLVFGLGGLQVILCAASSRGIAALFGTGSGASRSSSARASPCRRPRSSSRCCPTSAA